MLEKLRNLQMPWKADHSRSAGADIATADAPMRGGEENEGTDFTGVHDVVKSVDYWFEMEANAIEKEADELSSRWAAENLPTLNASEDLDLEPERILAMRCSELWQRWARRVHTKLQDGIDRTGARLTACIGAARGSIAAAQVARVQLLEAESAISQIEGETASAQGPVRYPAYIPAWEFWLLTIALVLVEFIANQPVFRIIWAIRPEVASELNARVLDVASAGGWLAGPKIALFEAASHFEASLLAAVVVVLLFVLAKSVGGSIRPLVALSTRNYRFAAASIVSLHRQKTVVLAASAIGTALVIYFLFDARGGASTLVNSRVAVAESEVARIGQRIDSLRTAGQIITSDVTMRQLDADSELDRLQSDLSFARTIESNNRGILLLNISLALAALVLGFMHDKRDITDTMGVHPDLPGLKRKCVKLEEQIIQQKRAVQDSLLNGERSIGTITSLLRADPSASEEGKRARLESIIPRWRAENARLRGLDPVSIAAFRRQSPLDLPALRKLGALERPDSFEVLTKELRSLYDALAAFEQRQELDFPAAAA